jgi:putative transcriptional regulator
MKQGQILIAKPYLQGNYFKRTVVYLCEDTDNGSLGFIINKPHGLLLKDVFPTLKSGNFPLYEGGPVAPYELFFIHTLGLKLSDSIEVTKGVYMGGNFKELTQMIEQGKISNKQVRFYIGCSSWSPNQLQEEIENDTWFLESANYDQLMQTNPDDMWGDELSKINPGFKAFSDFSFDPSLN